MSSLRPGDENLHYSDGLHRRWPSDPDACVEAWQAWVAAHVEAHREHLGGKSDPLFRIPGRPKV